MKKTMLCVLILLFSVSSAFAGGIWDMVKNSDLTVLKSRGYQLEVKGVNTRVYVFEVKEMKSVCTISYGDSSSSQMVCKTYKEMGIPR
jgi:hypothetical protein